MDEIHTPNAQLAAVDQQLVDGVLVNNRRSLAKTITLIESTRSDHQVRARQVLTALLPHTGKAIRVGISGVPGAGKSTFIETLGIHLIESGNRIAVLAVDPSSSVSGGSILGDKDVYKRQRYCRTAATKRNPDLYRQGPHPYYTLKCPVITNNKT